MSTTHDLLAELQALGVQLRADNGQLRYSAPQGAMNPELLGRLKEHRDELIGLLQQADAARRFQDAEDPIPVVPRGRGLPLSFAQQRLWFLDQLEGGRTATYNMPPVVLRIHGALDTQALKGALEGVVQRHEVMRSAFRVEDGQPVQIPVASARVDLPVIDLQAVAPEQQQAEIDRVVREQAEAPFELQSGQVLLRAALMRFSNEDHAFTLTMHHIIADGWSIDILVQELAALYTGLTGGETAPLPPLPIQFADYAAWEQLQFRGQRMDAQRTYWKARLAGAPDLLELPTDHPRPRVQRYRGQTEYIRFTPGFSARLNDFCRARGVTLYMALLTAYGALLSRYTGQQDLVIGSPMAVRPHRQTEGLIGLFLNTLPLRLDLSGSPSLGELLQRVRQVALESFEHRQLPLEQLLKELDLERNLEHSPLFQVLFGVQNAPLEPVRLAGTTITPLPPQNLYAVYDLVLNLEETAGGLEGKLRGNTDLFERSTLRQMGEHYRALVQALVEDPATPVCSVPILSDAEETRLADWSRPVEEHTPQHTLTQLFERQAERDSGAAALVCGDRQLSYGQLNARADYVAQRLRSLKVGPESLVGIVADRTLEMVVGILGILKAGAAYLPLDPTYPQERLLYMVDDSRVRVVVSGPEGRLSLPELPSDVRLIVVDERQADPPAAAAAAGTPVSGPENLAYLIYTSGSTGRPKGVEVEHRQVVRLLATTEAHFGFGPEDTWTLFHSCAFDFSVWELWGALLYGGRLVVVPHEVSRSPDQFVRLVASQRVTVLNQTPSAFRQFIRADADCGLEMSLKWVIFGGEALELNSLTPWIERHGDQRPQLVNMYGITETTVHASYRRISAADISAGRGSVIGRPLHDLGLYLVDAHLQPVPPGVPGEILVGGGGVARGYLERPELTRERFIPAEACPFAQRAGVQGRLYRSGDLARWVKDGDLEYMGRIDQQVKIRGFRVELGEIEAALQQHPDVAEVVVSPLEDDSEAGKRLVAYIVPRDGTTPAAPDLRELAERTLAAYMVPAAYVLLQRIPLTGNGKIDRRALPRPDRARPDLRSAYVAPASPLEQLIAQRWSKILDIEQIGAHDNFFELGGDSIKAAIFINQLQQQFSSVMYVVALFEAPTIAELAGYLRQHYPAEAAALDGAVATEQPGDEEPGAAAPRLNEEQLEQFRRIIPALAPLPADVVLERLPRALFVLSPPRSGSTLLRVVLAGHAQLFAPPELELLGFADMAERRGTHTDGLALYLEGTIRALMELEGCDADAARSLIAPFEDESRSVFSFYRELQSRLAGRILVDKTPSYALHREALERAELYFDEPLYIHLHRHPCGMIRSFEKASLEQIFFRHAHEYGSREVAELIWLHGHRVIGSFLDQIPAERWINVSFEALTRRPREQVERICSFIGVPVAEDMLQPYAERGSRMSDGIHAESRMIGDARFHEHSGIEAQVAERWRSEYREEDLGEPTRAMATSLGYELATDAASAATRVERRPAGSERQLSLAQQRLWFLDQLEGAGVAYSMPVGLRLEGLLETEALEGGMQQIAARHETLRSRFSVRDGAPAVEIAASLLPMARHDLRDLAAADRDAAVEQLARTDAEAPFDLSAGPLFRSALLQLSDTRHVLLINMHHIVSDGWSMGLLTRELSELYSAAVTGRNAELPELSVQYSDYASWQREYLSGGELRRQAQYWRRGLEGAPALLELPVDRPRPAAQRFCGSTYDFTIPASLVDSLRQLAEHSGGSLFMAVLSALGVLLARYSGQQDVVIGSPTANRPRSELEPLIGFFVNALAFRLQVDPEQGFQQLLAGTREMALGAYAHQDISFEQLVEELKPERNLSHAPVFQVLFALQNTPSAVPEFEGLRVSRLATRSTVSKYDLTLMAAEDEAGLAATFEYNTDLFDEATIIRMAGHLQHLLQAIIDAPDRPVGQLPLMNAAERRRLLTQWNDTHVELPQQQTIHQLIEAQADRVPDAIAVESGDQRLTYAQLDTRANRLARHLLAHGGGPGVLVGLCMERSTEMLVALLGILKSGSAYVPLDPAFPAQRLEYIGRDAGVQLVVSRSDLLGRLGGTTADMVLLDRDAALIDANEDARPNLPCSPDALAYVIYTSGSTGQPKGVMIEHRPAVNFLESMRHRPGFEAGDTLLAVTTVSFDIAVLELYLPLIVGARVVIADAETARDGALLGRALSDERITCFQATPATWRMLLETGWEGDTRLKALCGGEAMAADLAAQLAERTATLWNMYGPTETTVYSALHHVVADELVEGAPVPVGSPIANTTIYILDDELRPVPAGVTGELCIGGMGLARGYHNQPGLTQEVFVSVDPGTGQAERIYRTGDRARYRSDGILEVRGRVDNQVKIRGFRIELGEIEVAITAHPAVSECGVVLDQEASDPRLAAFYTQVPGHEADAPALRKALRERLPEYMIPAAFVAVRDLPLTPNGKIDRKALHVPVDAAATSASGAATSRDLTEMQLVNIWEELLETRPVGLRDDFFDLGGHSLIAVRLMARVERHFGRRLPLAALFQGGTVEKLAELLRSETAADTWNSLVPVRRSGTRTAVFCAAGAGGNVVYFHALAQALDAERPFYALQPPGLDGVTAPLGTIAGLAQHYIDAIRQVQDRGPYVLAGHSFGGLVAFEMAHRLKDAGDELEAVVVLDTVAPHFQQPTGADWTEAQWLCQVAAIVGHLYQAPLDISEGDLRPLAPDQQMLLLHGRLIDTGVLPPGADVQHLRGFVDVYKANLRAEYAIQHTPLDARVVLLRSRDLQPDALAADSASQSRAEPDLGWAKYLCLGPQVHTVPGDHLTMMRPPQVLALAAAIEDALG